MQYGRVFVLAGNRYEFLDWCEEAELSPREHRGETFYCDEGYRLRSQIITPVCEVQYIGSWQYRSGARHMLNDIQTMMRRRSRA